MRLGFIIFFLVNFYGYQVEVGAYDGLVQLGLSGGLKDRLIGVNGDRLGYHLAIGWRAREEGECRGRLSDIGFLPFRYPQSFLFGVYFFNTSLDQQVSLLETGEGLVNALVKRGVQRKMYFLEWQVPLAFDYGWYTQLGYVSTGALRVFRGLGGDDYKSTWQEGKPVMQGLLLDDEVRGNIGVYWKKPLVTLLAFFEDELGLMVKAGMMFQWQHYSTRNVWDEEHRSLLKKNCSECWETFEAVVKNESMLNTYLGESFFLKGKHHSQLNWQFMINLVMEWEHRSL